MRNFDLEPGKYLMRAFLILIFISFYITSLCEVLGQILVTTFFIGFIMSVFLHYGGK